MKCPWLKQVQKKTYKLPFRPDDVATSEVVISAFGECIRSECPFFELRTNHCRRSDQK